MKQTIWHCDLDGTSATWRWSSWRFFKVLEQNSPTYPHSSRKKGNDELPFLTVLMKRRGNCTLGNYLYHKSTHTDHPVQKLIILKTLSHRATRICKREQLSYGGSFSVQRLLEDRNNTNTTPTFINREHQLRNRIGAWLSGVAMT